MSNRLTLLIGILAVFAFSCQKFDHNFLEGFDLPFHFKGTVIPWAYDSKIYTIELSQKCYNIASKSSVLINVEKLRYASP